jgi:hypothetical protein
VVSDCPEYRLVVLQMLSRCRDSQFTMISQEELSWLSGLVTRLYSVPPPSPKEQNELQRALFEAQTTPAAWELVGHLLQTWEVSDSESSSVGMIISAGVQLINEFRTQTSVSLAPTRS